MAAPKGHRRYGPGRAQGIPNKTTLAVREAVAAFATANVDKMSEWLNSIGDPARKLELFLRALEFHVPKLARTEVSGADGEALPSQPTGLMIVPAALDPGAWERVVAEQQARLMASRGNTGE
jgi:hypothetical protein